MQRVIFCLTLCIIMIVGVDGWQANSSDLESPQLFYYSIVDQAFIAERGDGGEKRELAPFTLPASNTSEVLTIIVGPGWSVSGNWLAWRTSTQYGGASAAYIANGHTGEQFMLLDGNPVVDLQWSPAEDLLLVTSRSVTSLPSNPTYNTFIYDLRKSTTQAEVIKTEASSLPFWIPDGNTIFYLERMQDTDFELEAIDIRSQEATQKRLQGICNFIGVSAKGDYIGLANQLFIENVSTPDVLTFDTQ